MKNNFLLSIILLSFSLTTNIIAQDNNQANEVITYSIPSMRLLALEGTSPTLTFQAPTSGGIAIESVSSNTSWINYTSVVASGSTNNVTVAITDSEVPNGTTLKVVASGYVGIGEGTFGISTGEVILSGSSQVLLTGIASCYTGTGNTNGHQLTYTWSVNADDYANLVASGTSSLTATYTIIAGI